MNDLGRNMPTEDALRWRCRSVGSWWVRNDRASPRECWVRVEHEDAHVVFVCVLTHDTMAL